MADDVAEDAGKTTVYGDEAGDDGAKASKECCSTPAECNNIVSEERLNRYLALTSSARAKSSPLVAADSDAGRQLAMLMRMADDYSSDASHFKEIGDYVRSFAAINYAHAWIDAVVKLRLLDGHGDDELFTLP